MMNDISTQKIEDNDFSSTLGRLYLSYALSTITQRSLADARDGLKPVHRRLLYAMRGLKLDPDGTFKKCARIVGDVMGRYHPHGDQAIYDSLVRLAQDFSVRYPMVDGQGNFGNIDGDSAAAMRYTEARLTIFAQYMLQGLDENVVDMQETYDGENQEPLVLPAAFPHLLANGSSGIAVGMAAQIPPHNILEICDASLHILSNPKASHDDVMSFIHGPDFPTGAIIEEHSDTLRHIYNTGRGSICVRAKWHEDKIDGQHVIIITEIPYQVQKTKLIERIAYLIIEKKIPLLHDVQDESAEDLRIVLYPKNRQAKADIIMQLLFKQTDLENRFSFNCNALDNNGKKPMLLSLTAMLNAWLDHRFVVLRRGCEFRLAKTERRLEILQGYIICYRHLDEIIAIIREEDHPKAILMERFTLNDIQADAILNMRLRALRKLEENEIKKEYGELEKQRDYYQDLLSSPTKQRNVIRKDIKELRKKMEEYPEYSARRTLIQEPTVTIDIPITAFIEKEPITLVTSQDGWIRAFKAHLKQESINDIKYREGDSFKHALHCQTTDKILFFTNRGRVLNCNADKLPSGRGNGEPLSLLLELQEQEHIISIIIYKPSSKIFLYSKEGRGFVALADKMLAQTKNGKQVMNITSDNHIQDVQEVVGDMVGVIGDNRRLLLFALDELPEMSRGQGVKLQSYRMGGIARAWTFSKNDGLVWDVGQRQRQEKDIAPWLGKRGQKGKLPPHGFPK